MSTQNGKTAQVARGPVPTTAPDAHDGFVVLAAI